MPGVVSAGNCGIRCCSADTGFDDPVVQVVGLVLLGLSVTFGEEGSRSSSHR